MSDAICICGHVPEGHKAGVNRRTKCWDKECRCIAFKAAVPTAEVEAAAKESHRKLVTDAEERWGMLVWDTSTDAYLTGFEDGFRAAERRGRRS